MSSTAPMTSALTTRSFESQDVQVVDDAQSVPNLDGLVINPRVSHCAFQLGMAKQ
jgi:hypothetical protein